MLVRAIDIKIIVTIINIVNIVTGQVLFNKPDITYFKNQGKKFSFEIDSYLEALKNVSVVTEEQFKKSLDFISEMAIMLAEQGLTEINNKESEKKIEESERKFRVILKNQEMQY